MTKKLLIVAAFTLPLIPLLIIFTASARPINDTAARVERLQPLTFDQLARLPIGSEVLLEGSISDRSVAKFRTFVAYTTERHYLNTDLSDMWQTENTQSGSFILQFANGSVSISSYGYQIVDPVTVEHQPGNAGSNPLRYSGFQFGDRVTLIGTLASTGSNLSVKADVVIGGMRAAYLAAHQQTAAWSATLVGLGIALVAMLVIALYFGRRQFHRPSHAAV